MDGGAAVPRPFPDHPPSLPLDTVRHRLFLRPIGPPEVVRRYDVVCSRVNNSPRRFSFQFQLNPDYSIREGHLRARILIALRIRIVIIQG